MQCQQTPDGRPLDDLSAKLYASIAALARLNFLLVGLLLMAGSTLRSASMFGVAISFYRAGAVQALLAGGFTLGPVLRVRLSRFYSVAMIVPELGLIWTGIDRMRTPGTPPWDTIVAAGGCAILLNLLEAMRLARYRHEGSSLGRAMLPMLRTSLPYSFALVAAGLATYITQSGRVDLLIGVGVAILHLGAPRLLDRVAHLPIADTAWATDPVRDLVRDYPPLSILLSRAWQEAAGRSRGKVAT